MNIHGYQVYLVLFCLKILEGDDISVVISQRRAEKIFLFGLPGKPSLITLGIVMSPTSRTPQSIHTKQRKRPSTSQYTGGSKI